MFDYSSDFPQAVKDYEVFIWKKYPQKAILKLVGDRYKLSGIERSMLYRGVTSYDKAMARRAKLVDASVLKNEILLIDAFNQLLTIGSYLHGKIVFLSMDGILRDASEIHGKDIQNLLPLRSLEIMIAFLINTGIAGAKLIFDSQVSGHEAFCEKIKKALPDFKLQPEIIISQSTDKELTGQTEGIICTSDSQIIERSPLKIFDLARATLNHHFWPEFFDLNTIVNDFKLPE
jgi:hypothetical protein